MYQGDYLKSYLEKNRIKAPELAKLLDVSRQVVYQYFKSQSLERETVEKICKVLKVPVRDIFPDAFEPDYLISTPDKHIIVEIKAPEQKTQGAWFRKFIVEKGLTDTDVAETLQVALPDIRNYYTMKRFGTELIQSLKKTYPDFVPKEDLVGNHSEMNSVNDIKDLIIENLLEQVNELKEKLAGYEHPRKRKHA